MEAVDLWKKMIFITYFGHVLNFNKIEGGSGKVLLLFTGTQRTATQTAI